MKQLHRALEISNSDLQADDGKAENGEHASIIINQESQESQHQSPATESNEKLQSERIGQWKSDHSISRFVKERNDRNDNEIESESGTTYDDDGLRYLLLHPDKLPQETYAEDVTDPDNDFIEQNEMVVHDDIQVAQIDHNMYTVLLSTWVVTLGHESFTRYF